MKKFMNPEIAVERLEVEDVITTSDITGGGSGGNANEGGAGPED